MSQRSYVPNLKALGAPKKKWQAITHRQQQHTTDGGDCNTRKCINAYRVKRGPRAPHEILNPKRLRDWTNEKKTGKKVGKKGSKIDLDGSNLRILKKKTKNNLSPRPPWRNT